jgi:hypothetical protein
MPSISEEAPGCALRSEAGEYSSGSSIEERDQNHRLWIKLF